MSVEWRPFTDEKILQKVLMDARKASHTAANENGGEKFHAQLLRSGLSNCKEANRWMVDSPERARSLLLKLQGGPLPDFLFEFFTNSSTFPHVLPNSNLFLAMLASPYLVAQLPFGEVVPDPLNLHIRDKMFVDRVSYICAWECLLRSFMNTPAH